MGIHLGNSPKRRHPEALAGLERQLFQQNFEIRGRKVSNRDLQAEKTFASLVVCAKSSRFHETSGLQSEQYFNCCIPKPQPLKWLFLSEAPGNRSSSQEQKKKPLGNQAPQRAEVINAAAG
jgi:hypothetical protein